MRDFDFVDGMYSWCVDQKLDKKKWFGGCHHCLVLCRVWHSSGLIGNGGLHGYLDGVSGRHLRHVVAAYHAVGSARQGDIFAQAYQMYEAARYSHWCDTREVDPDCLVLRKKMGPEIETLEREFYDENERLVTVAAEFIRRNISQDKIVAAFKP